jgi:multisite-specific tRNA:(cytosine-C5)-methyltransferase
MHNRGPQARADDDGYLTEPMNMNNERFSAYYKAQKIVPDDEWDTFMDSLRRHLPTTFRVAGSRESV